MLVKHIVVIRIVIGAFYLWNVAHIAQGSCEFPNTWVGTWFQSGLPNMINVNTTSVDFKGTCVENDGDKFLIEDREDKCYRCVVIHQKHHNVLQYKESYCLYREPLDKLCSQITGDAPLYSMFRVEASPIVCPFKGGPPFSFSYNRGSGECKSPASKADSCTDDTRILLKYQACPDVHNSESTVEELTCLAMWRDGSMKYLVGKLDHKMASTDEDRYRCFVYSKNSRGYDLAQSGDATCNGLPSSTEGSRTMKFKKVEGSHHFTTSCKFPTWLTDHHVWHTLDYHTSYHFSAKNGSVRVSTNSGTELQMKASCNSILASSENQIVIIAQTTTGCRGGYTCIAFYKRDNHIVELQKSGKEVENTEEACSSHNFNMQTLPYITLITPVLRKRACPNLGKYYVSSSTEVWKMAASSSQIIQSSPPEEDKVKNCESKNQMLSLGCNSADTMQFHSDCDTDPSAVYSCHGDWTDNNGTSFFIAVPNSRQSSPVERYCFMVQHLGQKGEGSRRQLQVISLTHTCWRSTHQESHHNLWTFNITRHADCDGSPNSSMQNSKIELILFYVNILSSFLFYYNIHR